MLQRIQRGVTGTLSANRLRQRAGLANEIIARAVEMAFANLRRRGRVCVAGSESAHPAARAVGNAAIDSKTFSAYASGVSGFTADARAPGANRGATARPPQGEAAPGGVDSDQPEPEPVQGARRFHPRRFAARRREKNQTAAAARAFKTATASWERSRALPDQRGRSLR